MFRGGNKPKVNYSQSFNVKSEKIKSDKSQYINQRSAKTNASFHGRKVSVQSQDQPLVTLRNRFYSTEERNRRKSARLSQSLSPASAEDEFVKPPTLRRSKTTFIGEDRDFKPKTPTFFQRAASFRASVSKIFRKSSSPARKESIATKTLDGSSRSGSIDFIPTISEDNLKMHLTQSPKPPIKNPKPKLFKFSADERSGSFEYLSMEVPRSKPDQNQLKEEEQKSLNGTSGSSVFIENEMYQSSSISSLKNEISESLYTSNSECNEKTSDITSLDDILDEFNTISKKFNLQSKFTSDDEINFEIRKNVRRFSVSKRLSKSLTSMPSNGVFYEKSQKPSALLPEYITSLTQSLQKLNQLENETNLRNNQASKVSKFIFRLFSFSLSTIFIDNTSMR